MCVLDECNPFLSCIRNHKQASSHTSAFGKAFHFNLFSHSVKSAGLCRSKVEMGKGNDGLEGKSRQHAASQIGEERGRRAIAQGLLAGSDADMSYCCHSFDSYVVKMVAGE